MGLRSRNKGKVGERELAHFLMDRGFEAKRGVQYQGSSDSPDVVCPDLPGVHLECKRVEAGNPYKWMAQATRDAGGKVPVVAHRKNRQEWLAILPLHELLKLYREATKHD